MYNQFISIYNFVFLIIKNTEFKIETGSIIL